MQRRQAGGAKIHHVWRQLATRLQRGQQRCRCTQCCWTEKVRAQRRLRLPGAEGRQRRLDPVIWPEEVAPFDVGIINLRAGDEATDQVCNDAYAKLVAAGRDPLLDDTNQGAGGKFATMDLIGLPYQLILGPRGIKNGQAEVKIRATGERHELSIDDAISRLCEGQLS